jgi:hypothetical protein
MAALREILIAFGVSVDTAPIDKANQKADGLIQKLEKFGKALAAIVVIKRLLNDVFDLTNEAAQIAHTAEATGLSTHELQAWELGAKEAGIEGEGFTIALRKLSKELAGGSAKNQSKILHEYGLTAKGAAGHAITLSEALPAIAEKFKAMGDGPEKSAKAMELFGRQGARLIPLLNQGAAGIVRLKQKLDDLGGGFSPEFIKQAIKVKEQTVDLDEAWTSLKVRIYGLLLPALLAGVNALIKLSVSASDLIDRTHLLGSAVGVLGTILAAQAIRIVIAYAPVIATFLAWAAAIAIAILLVEDIYGFFTGKNSLIGEAIDAAFGEGSQQKVREWFQNVYNFGKEVFEKVKEIFGDTSKSFGTRLDEFLDYLGGAFATHFTGSFSDICQGIIAIFKVAVDAIEAALDALVAAAKAAGRLLGITDDDDGEFKPNEIVAPQAEITTDEIDSAFGPAKKAPAKKGPKKWFPEIAAEVASNKGKTVPVPGAKTPQNGQGAGLPPSWGDAPWAPVAPVVTNNFAIAPGTPQQQQRAIAAAAEHGTSKALKAPNRAASNAVSRAGKS